MKTLIFTATYNEFSNIEKFINKVFSLNKLDSLIITIISDKTFLKIVSLKKSLKNKINKKKKKVLQLTNYLFLC